MGEAKQRDNSFQHRAVPSFGQIVDHLCDDFERGWKQGERPKIDDFLKRVAEQDRLSVFAHLLSVELFWRRQASESPATDDYCRRFPGYSEAIDELFRTDRSAESVDNAEIETSYLNASRQASNWHEVPCKLGNYELIEEIGRGGMGVVYRAWQPSANRFVALKLIRRDRLECLPRQHQASVIHRFQHEAQAAGRIEHDHIVTVYEVGEVDGEHFFSMRYVEGQSLNETFSDGPLDGHRAARYLEPVARAVHEAHLHGILHRDLKPQNILIDGKTDRALVVDFGLAKLAEGAEEMTLAGDVMGTPPYMPPEQAKDSSKVTAKSDVYSLGATLYHAISGRPPFEGASLLEIIRKVADETPPSLSQINSKVDQDLETICLKCLEKDPSRRYASAELLADELRRYLNHEPIEARPISGLERGMRWCRRNPAIAAMICCTVVFFVAALVASIVGYVQTKALLAVAEEEVQHYKEMVDQNFTMVSEESLLNQPGMQPLRRKLLEQALVYYERFMDERGADPAIRDELATTAFRIGRITEQLESPEAAEPWYHRALSMQEDLVAGDPNNTRHRKTLGDTLNAMGGVHLARGESNEAQQSYLRAATLRRELASATPDDFDLQRTLANTTMNLGVVARDSEHFELAEERFLEAQTIRRGILAINAEDFQVRRDLAMGCYNLANLCLSRIPSDRVGAMSNFREALLLFDQLLEKQPNDLTHQYRAAVTARLLGDLLCFESNYTEAQQRYQRAMELTRRLAYHNPDVPEYRSALAIILMNIGELYRGDVARDMDYTASCFVEARQILEKLTVEYPDETHYAEDLVVTIWAVGDVAADVGDQQGAQRNLHEARQCLERLCQDFPDHPKYQKLLEDLKRRELEVIQDAP